jgi:hypothetical protein
MWNRGQRVHHDREDEDSVVVDDIQETGEDGELARSGSSSSRPHTENDDRHGDEQRGEIGAPSLLDPVRRVAIQAGDEQTGAGGDHCERGGNGRQAVGDGSCGRLRHLVLSGTSVGLMRHLQDRALGDGRNRARAPSLATVWP